MTRAHRPSMSAVPRSSAATEPLLERFGREVSTRQIAEAAGVAEGTIFRAFATKDELIDAVIKDSFDIAGPATSSRRSIGVCAEERLTAAVAILQSGCGESSRCSDHYGLGATPDHDSVRAKQQADNALVNSAIAALDQARSRSAQARRAGGGQCLAGCHLRGLPSDRGRRPARCAPANC